MSDEHYALLLVRIAEAAARPAGGGYGNRVRLIRGRHAWRIAIDLDGGYAYGAFDEEATLDFWHRQLRALIYALSQQQEERGGRRSPDRGTDVHTQRCP